MSAYVLAATGAGVLILFLYVVRSRRRSGKLPPSPPSLPLIGHLHLIGRLAHRSLHDLQLRHGSNGGLLLPRLGRRRTLVVSTAAAAGDLFRNHDLAFASRPRSVAGDKLMYGCSNVSFAPYGEPWRRAKKVAVDEEFLDVLLRLREEGGDEFELTDDRIKSMVLDMIAAATAIFLASPIGRVDRDIRARCC